MSTPRPHTARAGDCDDRARHRVLHAALLVGAAVLALVGVRALGARADESTGTWTGAVETRGNYYWERSTRVYAPAVHGELASPDGVRLSVDYLVDAITSASVAAGVNADVRFTEIRHDVGAGVGYEFSLGDDAKFLSTLRLRWSEEPDYTSRAVSLSNQLALDDRSTLLTLNASFLFDDVRQRVMGGPRMGVYDVGDRAGLLQDDAWDVDFNVASLTLGLTQTISPTVLLDVGYDFAQLDGYQNNVYRQVPVAGTPRPENHPLARTRHALYARLAWYVPASRTSLHALLRGYLDSWDIAAITPEARLYQEISSLAQLRLRYRFYAQSRAYFYRADSTDYGSDDVFVSADPKMSAFRSHLAGAQLSLGLDFLEGSGLDFARGGSVDFGIDYLWQTSRFGNGVIAQMGLRVPF